MVTFLIIFVAIFIYNVVAIFVVTLCFIIGGDTSTVVLVIIMLILYVVGFVYMSILWQLASVVTVLEDTYGIKAMMKGRSLIKGKMLLSLVIFFKLNLCLVAIQILFEIFVVHGRSLGTMKRGGFGILCFVLLFVLILLGLVIQTILYFVCKSYHHENIDKSSLSDHLEVYLGDYEPLNKERDVQLEQYI